MKSMGRRTYLISLGISILFTLFILSGQWSGAEGLSKGYYMAQGIACLLLFFAGTLGIFWIRDRFGWKLRTEDGQDFMEKRGIGVKREYLFALLAILLLYLPAFLAVFPGIFGYDGPGEILQFFLIGNLSRPTIPWPMNCFWRDVFTWDISCLATIIRG